MSEVFWKREQCYVEWGARRTLAEINRSQSFGQTYHKLASHPEVPLQSLSPPTYCSASYSQPCTPCPIICRDFTLFTFQSYRMISVELLQLFIICLSLSSLASVWMSASDWEVVEVELVFLSASHFVSPTVKI